MEDPTNSLISLTDVVSMFKHKIDSNERPFHRAAKEFTNRIADEWYKKVGLSMCDTNGKVQCGPAADSFLIMLEGRCVKNFMETGLKERIQRRTKKDIKFLIKFVEETDIQDFAKLGREHVSMIYYAIITYLKDTRERFKYENIYSQGDDPYKWYKLTNELAPRLSQENNPLGLTEEKMTEIKTKIDAVVSGFPNFMS